MRAVLIDHGVPCYVTDGGRLRAMEDLGPTGPYENLGSPYVDVTDWTTEQLRDWLGY